MALLAVEAGECKGCGHPLAETTTLEAEYAYKAEAVTCHGCVTASMWARVHQDQGGSLEGKQIRVSRRDQT